MARAQSTWRILTVGHSNHSPERLIELLAGHGIEVVVDVRSSPYARYATHFNKEPLEKTAPLAGGIKYLFLGDVLGGRPQKGKNSTTSKGTFFTAVWLLRRHFQPALNDCYGACKYLSIALLCSEEDPSECHRRLLLGRVMTERGVDVFHIRGDGRLQSETELAEELHFQKTKGQMTLFDTEEPQQWKSTQSVLRKERPTSFSMPCEEPESDA